MFISPVKEPRGAEDMKVSIRLKDWPLDFKQDNYVKCNKDKQKTTLNVQNMRISDQQTEEVFVNA